MIMRWRYPQQFWRWALCPNNQSTDKLTHWTLFYHLDCMTCRAFFHFTLAVFVSRTEDNAFYLFDQAYGKTRFNNFFSNVCLLKLVRRRPIVLGLLKLSLRVICNLSASKPIQCVLLCAKFKQHTIVTKLAFQRSLHAVTVLAVVLESNYLRLFVQL